MLPSWQETQLVIDQREQIRAAGSPRHLARFSDIHRHRFFTQNMFPRGERRQGHIAMKFRRRCDADEVHVFAGDSLAPVGREMRNVELPGG